jgi:hopanoid biosynthesis associated radical SAM protein HpnJ
VKKTLFLNPPSFDGFDGGAGARYPARREITSYWYPTWLAQSAAVVPGSRLLDAPPHGITFQEVIRTASEYDLIIMSTSAPSFENDVKCIEAIKTLNPQAKIGFVGPHVTALPEETLRLSPSIDFVCRNEFDKTSLQLAQGEPYDRIEGLSYHAADGTMCHTPDRERLKDLDSLPSVLPIYNRNLLIEKYFVGYLLHPYVSFYTGRGCQAKCTFCLWPQTIGGDSYRARSPEVVIREIEQGKDLFPQVLEWFIDDDTFTQNRARAIEISKGFKRLNLTWSCNARVNTDYDTLRQLKANGLRLLVVGFESGNQDILNRIRKGTTLEMARDFMKNCRRLGIKVHGTFILGLPIENPKTIEDTIRFAQELDPYTIQVSIAAPFAGTELYRQAIQNGWLKNGDFCNGNGIQTAALSYPDLSFGEIEESVATMYRRFYFRMKPLLRMFHEMSTNKKVLLRRLREGKEFLGYLHVREERGVQSVGVKSFPREDQFRNREAILLDFGGTLDSDGEHWLDRFFELYEQAGLDYPREEIKRVFYLADSICCKDPDVDRFGLRDLMKYHVSLQFDALGLKDEHGEKRIVEGFCSKTERILRRNALLLGQLRKRYRLGVVSNFYGNVATLCDEAGLSNDLDVILDSTCVGSSKPDPEIFRLALKQIKAGPAQTLFVGDSFERDIIPARDLGMKTIWLKGPNWRLPENHGPIGCAISSLPELELLLP